MYESLKREAAEAFEELCKSGNLKRGNLIVIGGSSSEIRGGYIGKIALMKWVRQLFQP